MFCFPVQQPQSPQWFIYPLKQREKNEILVIPDKSENSDKAETSQESENQKSQKSRKFRKKQRAHTIPNNQTKQRKQTMQKIQKKLILSLIYSALLENSENNNKNTIQEK